MFKLKLVCILEIDLGPNYNLANMIVRNYAVINK